MKLRTLLLLVSFCSATAAQTTLQPGFPIERELEAQSEHEFTIKVQENDFVQLVVEQDGIDVIVKLFSPTGKQLGDFDSPNGDEGPEHVSFVAGTAGSYRITVGPLDLKNNAKGRFKIKLLEVRPATDQELKTHKNLALTKTKGIALLAEIEETIPQIKSPQTRIRSELQVALLLWDIDQKRASKLFADAARDFKEFLASTDDIFMFSSTVVQLRQDVVQALAERDPDAALNFLQATSQIMSAALGPTEHFRHESALQLVVADHVARKDPKRALQLARQTLKQGYSFGLVGMVADLARQDPNLAAELTNDIFSKVIKDKLLRVPEAGLTASNLIRFSSESATEATNGEKRLPYLSEDRVKELVQKVLDEALSYSASKLIGQSYDPARDSAWNMLTALKSFSQLDSIIPGSSAAVEKKMAEMNPAGAYSGRVTVASNDSGELTVETIEKMQAGVREDQYLQLAYNKGNKGDLTGARQIINERVTNPSQRRYALMQIEQIERSRALDDARIEDVLKSLRAIQHIRDRAQQISQLAHRLGPGLKRTAALNLLEQVRSLLSPSLQAQDQDQMAALLELSRAFLRYDAKRSFEIIEPLVDQFNELSAAARTLDGFNQEYYDDEEMDLQNGNALVTVVNQISSVLADQAVVNFERAKATTDRITAPEVRLKIYLDIAARTIKNAN